MLKIMFRSAVILAVMAMICSCYQLTKRSSTVNHTEKLINKYLRDNNIVLDSTNTFTINLEEVLGIQYDSLLTFGAFDTCLDVQIITGATTYGPPKGGYIGGGWESEAELLILMKNGQIVYDDSHTCESSRMEIPYRTIVTKIIEGNPRFYRAGISYSKLFYLRADKGQDPNRLNSKDYHHFIMIPMEQN